MMVKLWLNYCLILNSRPQKAPVKLRVIFFLIFATISLGYFNASSLLKKEVRLSHLKLQMSENELVTYFGSPYSRENNRLTFILDDASLLFVGLQENRVVSALVKYHRPVKIQDPRFRHLTLVQMDLVSNQSPSYFFAGKPEEGLIYKVTKDGVVESLTWVPPFIHGQQRAKNLQALLKDFRTQNLTNM
jgi:hypothetical protein